MGKQREFQLSYLPFLFLPISAMEPSDVLPQPPIEMAELSEENGSAAAEPEAPVGPIPSFSMLPGGEDEERELPADFERMWKATHENPHDFTSWTDLLQYCEQEVCAEPEPAEFGSSAAVFTY